MISQESAALWPYSERNGTNVDTAVETLLAEPEIILDQAEKKQLNQYAQGLFDGSLETGGTLHTLEEIYKKSIIADDQQYFTDYFYTPAGRDDLGKLGIRADPNLVKNELFASVATNHAPESKIRKEVANHSRDWYTAELTTRVLDTSTDAANYHDTPVFNINYAPDNLLTKLEWLQGYRKLYRTVRQNLKQHAESPLTTAENTLLDIHIARVNNMIGMLYPQAVHLAEQLAQSPAVDRVTSWQQRLFSALPLIRYGFEDATKDHTAFTQSLVRRLDLVRNGANGTGTSTFSPISPELDALATELEANRLKEKIASEALYPTAIIEKLSQTNWDASQLKTFLEVVLKEWELLSDEQTDWNTAVDRSGVAPDGKWQVIVSPKVTSLTTNDTKKILYVPEEFNRTLTQQSPPGGLLVSAHELGHVLQAEQADELSSRIPLAKVKGRRHLTTYEMGGIYEERLTAEMLGQQRPTNTSYLRALQAKLAGGNQTEVAKAYLAASVHGEQVDDTILQKKAKTASKSILRLYRSGGESSQVLDYLEQELLLRSMNQLPSEEVRAIALAGASFSIKDSAALHKIGVIDVPKNIGHRPAEDVLRIFMDMFYDKLDDEQV